MTTLAELLRDHVGHKLTLVEPAPQRLALKCCSTTCSLYGKHLDLTAALGIQPVTATATAVASRTERRDPQGSEQCPAHIGEWIHNCRPCAAETKARPDDAPTPPPAQRNDGSHVPAVAAVKAQLAAAASAKTAARGRVAIGQAVIPPLATPERSTTEQETP